MQKKLMTLQVPATAIAIAVLFAGFMPGFPLTASAAQAGADSIASDRMAIEETLRRYVRALDDSDLDAYLATLTDDAKFVAAEGSYAGKDAIRKYVEPVMKSRLARREKEGLAATATHHVVTNQSFEFVDRDNVVVRAYWMFVVAHGTGKPNTIDIMGSSEDFLTRKGGKWLIRERRVTPQMSGIESTYAVRAKLWKWPGAGAAWFFITLPARTSREIQLVEGQMVSLTLKIRRAG